MSRIVVILSLCLAACDVGELPGLTGDGGGSGGDGSASAVCAPISTEIQAGHHNPPMTATGCMSAAGCHNQGLGLGTNAPAYSYAGMLYKMDKVTPYAGATIFVEMGGALKKTESASNGEFFMVPGVAGLDPPTNEMQGKTFASGCPTVSQPMVTPLLAGSGDCSKSGCHAPLNSAAPGNGPIYLP